MCLIPDNVGLLNILVYGNGMQFALPPPPFGKFLQILPKGLIASFEVSGIAGINEYVHAIYLGLTFLK